MYGLALFFACVLMVLTGEKLVRERGLDKEIFYRLIFHSTIGAVVGARAYHVIHLWGYYQQNIVLIPQIWLGGLGIWGAVFGGLVFAAVSARMLWGREFWISHFSRYLEVAAVVLPLGQAFGRLGNFFNYELFGYPTNLPWGIYIPYEHRLPGFESFSFFHPLFLYESILCLILFLCLFSLFRKKCLHQDTRSIPHLFLLYLIGYSCVRFCLEFLRIDPWRIANIPVAQIVSVCCVVLGLLAIYASRLKQKQAEN